MKKLPIAIASVLGMTLSSASYAILNMDNPTDNPPGKFAKELAIETSGEIKPKDSTLNVKVKLGFSIQSNKQNYARFDLDNNAKFSGTALADADLVCAKNEIGDSCGLLRTAANIKKIAGGASGDSYVVYELTNSSTDKTIAPSGTLELKLVTTTGTAKTAIRLSDKKDVKIKYRLFADQTTATKATDNSEALKKVEAPLIVFAKSGIDLSVTKVVETTVSVADEFKKFKSASGGGGVKATIGTFKFSKTENVLNRDAEALKLTDLLKPESKLVISSGDVSAFAAAFGQGGSPVTGGVFLAEKAQDCKTTTTSDGVKVANFAKDGKTVNLVSGDIASTGNTTSILDLKGETHVCFLANGSTPIPAAKFTLSLEPVPQSGISIAKEDYADKALGSFVRNGTTLQATFTNNAEQTANRFTFTNSNSAADAKITAIRVLKQSGAVDVDLSKLSSTTIPKGGVLTIQRNEIDKGKTVVFTIAAPPSNISGTYQLLMTGSNTQSIVQMVSQ